MYLIRGLNETDEDTGEHLFWSNDLGWVDRENASQFSHIEHLRLNLPQGGIWEKTG